MSEVANTWLGGGPHPRGAIGPTGSSRDHELRHARPSVDDEWQGAMPSAQLPERGQQSRVVLARLHGPDGEDEPGLEPFGKRPRGNRRRRTFRDHLNLRVQPGNLVKV